MFYRRFSHLSMASDSFTTMAKWSFLISCSTSSSWALVHLGDRKDTSHEIHQLHKKNLTATHTHHSTIRGSFSSTDRDVSISIG